MFKNRVLQVKMVKAEKPTVVEQTIEVDQVVTKAIAQAADSTKDLILFSAKIAAGFMILNAAQKVAIELAKNK